MIKRANRESRPIPLPTLLGRCVVRLIELPPHFVITPRRPRGVAVATTAAPETRLADLHARGNHPFLPLFPRISSNVSPLSRPTPHGCSIYTRFNLAGSLPPPHHSPLSSHRRFIDDGGVAVRKNRIKDVPNNAWIDLCADSFLPGDFSRSFSNFYRGILLGNLRIKKRG